MSPKMNQKRNRSKANSKGREILRSVFRPVLQGLLLCLIAVTVAGVAYFYTQKYPNLFEYTATATGTTPVIVPAPKLDIAAYNEKLDELAHIPPPAMPAVAGTSTSVSTSTSTASSTGTAFTSSTTKPAIKRLWPVSTVYPEYGALLPFNRIVAYYGNFYSTGLGVLGEYPPQEMLQKLMAVVASWQAADPTTPVIPALDYIVVTSQGAPDPDGLYNLRMPDDQIEEAITLANQVNGLVFLDIQLGQSNVETEIPRLAQYLKLPNVELSLDPEFAMKTGQVPGTIIGTLDATDINYAADYLANIVDQNNIPPKILVVHRFTEDMVTNYQNITPLPEVQVLMDMDGWGYPQQKIKTYQEVIYDDPVQFTGFKLFYKNDLFPPSTRMLTPAEILNLTPAPSYIQYQ
jgi:hypothetical protein